MKPGDAFLIRWPDPKESRLCLVIDVRESAAWDAKGSQRLLVSVSQEESFSELVIYSADYRDGTLEVIRKYEAQ